ncbi:MAG: hypothetical protein IPM91_13815 [Bacteroidetes bacterium]|nr:hypothetical protein [Bacteroidota bacterium]
MVRTHPDKSDFTGGFDMARVSHEDDRTVQNPNQQAFSGIVASVRSPTQLLFG